MCHNACLCTPLDASSTPSLPSPPSPAYTLSLPPRPAPLNQVVEIDKALHREAYKTSTGTRWPAKNDRRVIVRLLLNSGVTPPAGDAKVAKYIGEYAAKLGAKTPATRR